MEVEDDTLHGTSDGQETVLQKPNRLEVEASEAEQHYPLLEVGT
jgi:hypothetical protein